MWLALELRGMAPKAKVYLNPAASGPDASAHAVAEGLARLGYREGIGWLRRYGVARYPERDAFPFFGLDLGDWAAPRVKVYVAHRSVTAADVAEMSRAVPGRHAHRVEEFVRLAAGAVRLHRKPVISCFSFTRRASPRPTAHTVHVPIRDYVTDDRQARDRATTLMRLLGIDSGPLDAALAALTSRRLDNGAGLIAYLALSHADGQPPRVMAYLSTEAYRIRPPAPSRGTGAAEFPSPDSGRERG